MAFVISGIFNQWVKENYPQIAQAYWLAVDGKSLRITVTNHADKSQNFATNEACMCQENSYIHWFKEIMLCSLF